MAILSDQIIILANEGYLAPGQPKISMEILKDKSRENDPINVFYRGVGKQFKEGYTEHLADFGVGQLEQDVNQQAQGVQKQGKPDDIGESGQ